MTRLVRGFKARAARLALELRAEIGLGEDEAFDPPERWADLYGIAVVGTYDLDCVPAAQFFAGRSSWSAALIPVGTGRTIVYNAAHAPVRVRSDQTHECAHVALEHAISACLFSDDSRSSGIEAEAQELAGELLVPSSAARRLARRQATDAEVALRYGVSEDLARWRMQSTGARLIAIRAAAARGR